MIRFLPVGFLFCKEQMVRRNLDKSMEFDRFLPEKSNNPFIFRDIGGKLSPRTLSQTARRHQLRSHNLELTALGCPLRWSLDSPEDPTAPYRPHQDGAK